MSERDEAMRRADPWRPPTVQPHVPKPVGVESTLDWTPSRNSDPGAADDLWWAETPEELTRFANADLARAADDSGQPDAVDPDTLLAALRRLGEPGPYPVEPPTPFSEQPQHVAAAGPVACGVDDGSAEGSADVEAARTEEIAAQRCDHALRDADDAIHRIDEVLADNQQTAEHDHRVARWAAEASTAEQDTGWERA